MVWIVIEFIAFFASLISSAKPRPSVPWTLKLFIPITSPSVFISGPPELPGFSGTSIWK